MECVYDFSLAKSEVIEELVSLITKEPSNDVEERLRYRYSNIACELLTCDVPTLNEKLAGEFNYFCNALVTSKFCQMFP